MNKKIGAAMPTLWKIIISVVITAGVAGGGVYYIMQRQIDSIRSDNQVQMDNLNKQIATLKSVDLSGSKIYTNSAYGFSFKYPSDWSSETSDENNGATDINLISFESPADQYGTGTLSIYEYKSMNDFLKSWAGNEQAQKSLDQLISSGYFVSVGKSVISGAESTEFLEPAAGGCNYDAVISKSDGSLIFISFVGGGPFVDCKTTSLDSTQTQILSTFQFTK
jgi:hypothetical protein